MGIMDFSKTPNSIQSSISTIIGSGTKIVGRIETKSSCRIDGIVEGAIDSQHDISIAENAQIKGNVSAKNIIVAGEIIGDVSAIELVEIKKSGKVAGNISGTKLIVDEGASYKGKVIMGEARKQSDDDDSPLSEKVKEIIGI